MARESTPQEGKCPACGRPLPTNAPLGLCPQCLVQGGALDADDPGEPEALGRALQSLEGPGAVIGPYKLLQQIGEGGFGVVYMAEQREPIVRRVALKIIKLGMDTHSVVARFEAERQALAMMDHPHIAKVLDAGATETGRPYFVMELVKGTPITEYCDENRLSTDERLKLFMEVCGAVQHAHQKGIIHRDLKPSNILISIHEDDRPVPKVIDFGIAKAMQHRLTEKTLFTEFRQMIGTPAYMSPEQAQFSGLDTDTRSDIYSLGVLLYELLTGKTPFDAKELLSKGYDEICRCIREEEPPKPSTRWSTLARAEQSSRAKTHSAEPRELGRALRGDLDWIVMKALEKDRRRRYDTANSLRLDVRRFLDSEPVTAAAPSTFYKLRKLARRRRGTFAAVTAIAAALIIGLGLALYAFAQERAAKSQAELRFQQAEEARHDADLRRVEAEEARRAESEQRRLAQNNERRARQLQYASDLRLAQTAVRDADVPLATELLESHEPEAEEPDYRGWEWRFLKDQLRQEQALVRTHASLSEIAVSPDGQFMAAAGSESDGSLTVEILDVSDLTLLKQLALSGHWDGDMCCSRAEDPNGWVAGMSFSRDNRTLIVERNNNQGVLRFDLETGERLHLVPRSTEQVAPAWPAKISPDRKWLIGMYEHSEDRGRILRCFDVATGVETAVSAPFEVSFPILIDHRMRVAPDGTRVCVSCQDDTLRIFSLPGLTELGAIQVRGEIYAVVWSPDSRVVVTGYKYPWIIDFWEADTGRHLDSLAGSQATPVLDLCFSPDGRLLASATYDSSVVVWDVQNSVEHRVFRGHMREVNALAFLPDGQTLVTGGRDGTVRFWDVATTQTDLVRAAEESTLWNCVYAPNGRYLATTGPDGVVRLFDAISENLLSTLRPDHIRSGPLPSVPWAPISFSPDGHTVVAGNGDHTATVYDVMLGKSRFLLEGHTQPLVQIRLAPDGRTIATTGEDNVLILWDAATGKVRQNILGPRFIDFYPNPDSDLLAYGGKDGFTLLHLDSGQTKTVNTREVIYSVTFSPDGETLAVGFRGEVRLYSVPALAPLDTLTGSAGPVPHVAFAPDGQTLAIPSWNGFVQLWNMHVMSDVGRLPIPFDHVIGARFSPDGSTIAVSTRGHGVRQFRAPTFEQIAARADSRP